VVSGFRIVDSLMEIVVVTSSLFLDSVDGFSGSFLIL